MYRYNDFDSSDIKEERKRILGTQKISKVFITGLLLLIVISIPMLLVAYIVGSLELSGQESLSRAISTAFSLVYNFVTTFTFINLILKYSREEEIGFFIIKETFKNTSQRIGMTLLKVLLLFLWSLIAIVAMIVYGIVFSYSDSYNSSLGLWFTTAFILLFIFMIPAINRMFAYIFSEYIMLDDETVSPLGAINRSKAVTKGYKWKLFVVTLKLSLMVLLAYAVFAILAFVIGEFSIILAATLLIPLCIVITYFYIICFLDISIYYNFLSGYYEKRDSITDDSGVIDNSIAENDPHTIAESEIDITKSDLYDI